METGGKQQHDVGQRRLVAADDSGQLLEGERSDTFPHVKGLADGVKGAPLSERRRDLLGQYAGGQKAKALGPQNGHLPGRLLPFLQKPVSDVVFVPPLRRHHVTLPPGAFVKL